MSVTGPKSGLFLNSFSQIWHPVSTTPGIGVASVSQFWIVARVTPSFCPASAWVRPRRFRHSNNSTPRIAYPIMVIQEYNMPNIFTFQAFRCQIWAVSYTHLRAHETGRNLVCRLLL